MRKKTADCQSSLRVRYAAQAGEVAAIGARELANGLAAMLGGSATTAADSALRGNVLLAEFGSEARSDAWHDSALSGDSFEISPRGENALAIRAGSARGLLHGSCDLLERLGAKFVAGVIASLPQIEPAGIAGLKPYTLTPAFKRRAFVSDIMTWNYNFEDRLELHLKFDREFVPWMGRRGVNAFEYIRHAHDSRLRIDELVPLYKSYGIGSEYGGHVLQLLMQRELFQTYPQYFPMAADGARMAHGNLCASNPDAVRIVSDSALNYLREHPENELLHIWGADVLNGAWCNCPECKNLSPQLQYLKIVNAVASAEESAAGGVPVAYLAYHDTIDPDPKLRPLPNVWFEWAPRERCYVHAIDDPSCSTNPRYFESLKRYVDIFRGRGHIFEYYADAILFGGLGFATPTIIARDLRAYRSLGIESISCLTFGAYSVLAYPVNLEAFVRGTRSLDFEPSVALGDVAAARHPAAAEAIGKAYRSVEKVSALVLDYADVMQPYKMTARKAGTKKGQIAKAIKQLESAVRAAEGAKDRHQDALAAGEQELWSYGLEVLSAMGDYLRAREEKGVVRKTLGESAIANVAGAIDRIRNIDPDLKGTWGAYDLEWIRELWLDGLRRNLAEDKVPEETL